jgi:hypothetical protein
MAKVITKEVRLAYVHLFEPYAMNEGQEAKFSCCVMIPENDQATLNTIEEAIEEAKQEGAQKFWGGKIPRNLKLPLRSGSEERPDQPEFENHYFFNCNTKQKPGIVDSDRMPIFDTTEVYSGIYARVSVNFYPFNSNGNKGIAVGLNNVQKLRDGEPLNGRSRAEDDFAEEIL